MLKSKIFLLIPFLWLFACQSGNEIGESAEMSFNPLLESPPPATDNAEELSLSDDRKLIKNGRFEFETADIEKTTRHIKQSVAKLKGYLSNEIDTKSDDRESKNMIIRIPSSGLDSLVKSLEEEAVHFDYKEITVEDVTSEFVDIQARLKNKKATEETYLQLLKKATSVNDILNIEKQIGEIRGEIESVEGRLKLLQNQVSYSTLNVTFYKYTTGKNSFFYEIKTALYEGWKNFLSAIVFLFSLWPFMLAAAVIYAGYRKYRRNKRTSK